MSWSMAFFLISKLPLVCQLWVDRGQSITESTQALDEHGSPAFEPKF